ncbi:MAG: FkbM family methyltransferase [Rhizobacter sp.]
MSLYESIAARLIGTPLQRPAQWLQGLRGASYRRAHPELAEWFREGERTQQVLQRVIGPSTNCIDVGCHIGSFLQTIVTMAPQGRHYAVEPVPHKAAWLQKRFPRVSVLQVALSDSNGSAEFFVNEARTSYSGFKARAVPGELRAVQVARRRLDDLIPEDANIGFIKIDVNGGELMALQGALRLLRRDRPFVLLECTRGGLDDYGIDSDQVHACVVQEAGYRIQLLKDYLEGGPALEPDAFRKSMEYPFQAFNYAVVAA